MKIKKIICLILLISIITTFFGCTKNKADVSVFSYSSAQTENTEKNEALHFSNENKDELLRISRSDMTTLFFNENNYSISVYDVGSAFLWNSLPEKYIDGYPSIVEVKILVNGCEYTLNSSDNSVATGDVSYESTENSISINYGFSKEIENYGAVAFNIPILFTVADGMLTVSADLAKLSQALKDSVIIESISLLPYFGANDSGVSGDFIFVPDGCGAIISTKNKAKKFPEITIPVYGADYSANEKETGLSANIGAFGMKRGNSAYIALIESGDAIASIQAGKALKDSSYNNVGATFDITKTYKDKDSGKIYAQGKSYDGALQISYRFLSGENATYPAMASACRELLIRNGLLKSTTQKEKDTLPMNLCLIGASEVEINGKAKLKSVTEYSQAEDILTSLKAKGIKSINLRYDGLFAGGINQELISDNRLSSKLGNKKQLASLIDYSKKQNINIFANANILSFSEKGKSGETAMNLLNEKSYIQIASLFSDKLTKKFLINASKITENTNSMITYMRGTDFDGISIEDAGNILYSDNSIGKISTRQETKSIIESECNAVSSSKALMVENGNIYTVKYADSIWELPDSIKLSKNKYCTAVPFLQILLHGFTDYSGSPVNLSADSTDAILRCVEYGSLPSFCWSYDNNAKDKETDKYFYLNSISDAQIFYERMNVIFEGLLSAKITNHYKVKSGVYCTEYDNNSTIYVNYNKSSVTVNGATIEGKSFIRIN